jgi:acetyl esterase/lipase
MTWATSVRRPGRTAIALLVLAITLTGCQRGPGLGTPVAPSAATPGASAPTGPDTGTPGTATPVTSRYSDVPTADPGQLSLDVYTPSGPVPAGGRAAIVWVHGGAWQIGDKQSSSIPTKAAWAAAHDRVLVSVNYRLATDGPIWPEPARDVAAATSWVLDHADELGVDPSRVALIGHSAGAHLAAEVLAEPAYLALHGHQRDDVACLVTLDAAGYDLTDDDPVIAGMVHTAIGDDPATLAEASPLLQVQQAGGPVPATLVVTRGAANRTQEAQRYADAVTAAGPTPAELVDTGRATHQDLNVLLGAPGDQVVTPAVDAFLAGCLG